MPHDQVRPGDSETDANHATSNPPDGPQASHNAQESAKSAATDAQSQPSTAKPPSSDNTGPVDDTKRHTTDSLAGQKSQTTDAGAQLDSKADQGSQETVKDRSPTATAETAQHGTSPTRSRRSTKGSHSRPTSPQHTRKVSALADGGGVSEWSHQHLAPKDEGPEEDEDGDDGWQTMPAYAQYDLYDDDGKLIAREKEDSDQEEAAYGGLGGAGKGYTRVQIDDDAKSTTSMDENTAYLLKEPATNTLDDDEEQRDATAQMQTTKNLLTDNQRIAYVGVVRLAMAQMVNEVSKTERTRGDKKQVDLAIEAIKMWTQKMMLRLYGHMELDPAEQIMIEQLAEHGLEAGDLTPALMANARVKNPINDGETVGTSPPPSPKPEDSKDKKDPKAGSLSNASVESFEEPLPAYQEHADEDLPPARLPSELPKTDKLDIDLRWTVLCDLFLILISDSVYDARSRVLLERVGAFMDVSWLDICRFEKRVTDSLEMQEARDKETWNEDEHMENRRKAAVRRRLVMMGLATVGGSLVIGLSAGLLGPLIGAGLAAGFTTIGVTGTSGFLAGAGGAAIVGTTGVITGGTVGVRAANRRTGAVKTYEYRPLHNNKRVNLIVTVAGWLNGKVDDVRLPFSTVDPIMGDIYSIWWEPEMLTSMGQTISILATEALTQGLQQILGSTILISLMAALQVPIVLSKLSYLIDNPWSVSLARADRAGLILADSLIDRNLGARPITLVGFSIGSRVIFAALKELARKGALGLVQNVYLFGSPMVANKDDYLRARTVVAGRFVNGYATNDWILGYLFRATSGGIMRVAGLAKVEVGGIENIDVTQFVDGHMAYRKAMPRILREMGWQVTSDEFSEIEDPDPDNHEKRQRELINEIEEARKELQEKPEKKRFFGAWRRKKGLEKKSWEIYDERAKAPADDREYDAPDRDAVGTAPPKTDDPDGVLFDVEAIRKEAVELASQGLAIKELESTLPPLKIDSPPIGTGAFALRPSADVQRSKSATSLPYRSPTSATAHDVDNDDDGVTMTFEAAPAATRPSGPPRSQSIFAPKHATAADGWSPVEERGTRHNVWAAEEGEEDDEFGEKEEVEMTFA